MSFINAFNIHFTIGRTYVAPEVKQTVSGKTNVLNSYYYILVIQHDRLVTADQIVSLEPKKFTFNHIYIAD